MPSRQSTEVHDQPGEFITGSYTNPAGTRPYKLYVPARNAEGARSLVVMLHGCTQTADDFATGTRMNALAEERHFLVLYPAQTQAASHARCWNWFKHSDDPLTQGEAAIIAGMTRAIISGHGIDRRRVYVAGLSAGGAMAAVLGATCPALYAGVGIHSGLANGSAHDLQSAFAAMRGLPASQGRSTAAAPTSPAQPIIVFHGDRDTTVHPRNGEQVVSQSVDRRATSSAGATIEQGRIPDGHAYTRTIHYDRAGRPALEHWLVHGAGHAWFGGSPNGSMTDPKGPDAAREMIRFFFQSAGGA
ncbi:MAG TPA: PHB depolymerase family esterase [Burkholderiaceae bacterium]|nr:PHB depolymerase family esterase [Burkholderiaceae bacterium]